MRGVRSVLAVAVLATVLLVAGCSSAPSTPAGGSSSGSGATGGTASAPSAVSVSLMNSAFDPADITVAVGGTVTFTNNDAVDHTVTGDAFDSGVVSPGKSFSQKFPTAGTFPIRCKIHPMMAGSVTVK